MTRACYVHWRDCDCTDKGGHEFVVMWSDGTWEIFNTLSTEYMINEKTYKQFMNLNYMISSQMEKEEAINYINQKIKEIKELGY